MMRSSRSSPKFSSAFARLRSGNSLDPCSSLEASACFHQQILHPHQVVAGRREREHPCYSVPPFVFRLPQVPSRLHPSKDFFNSLASFLAYLISHVACCSAVDRAVLLLCYVRRNVQVSQLP